MRVATISTQPFHDRIEAGLALAEALRHYADRDDVVVLGLPRGGVPIANEIASKLDSPLDVLVVGKLGVPGHEELAMGAIASGGVCLTNQDVVRQLDIPQSTVDAVARHEEIELERRERLYRGARAPRQLQGRVAILVDDGLATGSTMRAAIVAARKQGPARIVVAAPVGAPSTCRELALDADEVVCVRMPDPFFAVGLWYSDFTPTSDQEVRELLEQHR